MHSDTDKASRVFWVEKATKLGYDMGVASFFWDNGEEVDRNTFEWRTPELLAAILRATSGENYTVTRQ